MKLALSLSRFLHRWVKHSRSSRLRDVTSLRYRALCIKRYRCSNSGIVRLVIRFRRRVFSSGLSRYLAVVRCSEGSNVCIPRNFVDGRARDLFEKKLAVLRDAFVPTSSSSLIRLARKGSRCIALREERRVPGRHKWLEGCRQDVRETVSNLFETHPSRIFVPFNDD